ncbi:glycosyltransferase family 2 protein [Amycolatopsis anabasis]|uniref:glycosyltransferase family 2 protein n=1 Tax=Amycolatopsis anabasis TaxID=1840409 RepID=UPI00131B0378|nr:glycosyltransferase [Amycolatopsis anabasis]
MRTTVVIATRNRRELLARTLEQLARLRPRPPVVVVDNASRDGTVELVRRDFPEVDVIPLPRNEGAVARTAGVACAETPYVAFSDDDSWWAPGALPRAEQDLDAHPDLAVVVAKPLVGEDHRPDPVTPLLAESPLGTEDGLPSVLGFLACAAVVRKDAYLDVGGFSPLLRFVAEEKLLAYDLAARGWKLRYDDQVCAHHDPAPRAAGNRGRRTLELRNNALIAWLRRPAGVALRTTARLLPHGVRELAAWRALAGVLRRLPAALAGRDPLPRDVERQVRLLEKGHGH